MKKKKWKKPELISFTTIGNLCERLKELPSEAAVLNFHLEWCDTDGYPSTIGSSNNDQQGSTSVFTECRKIWNDAYEAYTDVGYHFSAKDAGSLKQLINKIETANKSSDTDLTKATFSALIKNLPEWYLKNAFSIAIINSKFNEITASIRKNGKEKSNSANSDYAQSKLDILNS